MGPFTVPGLPSAALPVVIPGALAATTRCLRRPLPTGARLRARPGCTMPRLNDRGALLINFAWTESHLLV